jgi:ParB family transcriptional regulator, chromosome partitioning protein
MNMIARKPKGLGRGLEALLGGDRAASDPEAPTVPHALPLDWLQPGRYQPRTRMDEASLQDLAASIRSHGMMQPIVVRTIGERRYEIVAGERRFRAARIAGLDEVPVMLREVSDQNALAMALIENIQREDLNPLEEAQAIQRLLDEFQFTHEQASEAIGRSRSATSNLLRLLNLAPPVQTMLLAGDLEMGHARALLVLDRAQQILTATRVVEKRLSVRETEKLTARMLAEPGGEASGSARQRQRQPGGRDVERLQERLADRLATPVEIRVNASGKGRLVIHFGSADQFDGVLASLGLKAVLLEE